MKRKLAITLICPQVYPLFNSSVKAQFGGAEVQMRHLAKQLVKNSAVKTVNLLVADYGQAEKEVIDNICFYKALPLQKGVFRQAITFFRALNKPRTDIFLQVTLTPFSGIIAMYCRFRGKKFIYWTASDADTDGTLPFAANPIKKTLSELVFKFANHIIVQNSNQGCNLQKMGFTSHLIPSFYEMSETTPDEKTDGYHLWVARSSPMKRAELFIELASYFPEEKFVMICQKSSEGSAQYYAQLQLQARQISNLEFIKFVPVDANMSDFFKKAKTFSNTSTFEGTPTTFIEAAKNSVPLLALKINPDKIFERYECGYCCGDNMQELREKLQLLITDVEGYKQKSKNSFLYASENHNLESNVGALANLF